MDSAYIALGWLIGLPVLWFCWRVAVFMASPVSPEEVECARIDAQLDAQDEFDAWRRREARI